MNVYFFSFGVETQAKSQNYQDLLHPFGTQIRVYAKSEISLDNSQVRSKKNINFLIDYLEGIPLFRVILEIGNASSALKALLTRKKPISSSRFVLPF